MNSVLKFRNVITFMQKPHKIKYLRNRSWTGCVSVIPPTPSLLLTDKYDSFIIHLHLIVFNRITLIFFRLIHAFCTTHLLSTTILSTSCLQRWNGAEYIYSSKNKCAVSVEREPFYRLHFRKEEFTVYLVAAAKV